MTISCYFDGSSRPARHGISYVVKDEKGEILHRARKTYDGYIQACEVEQKALIELFNCYCPAGEGIAKRETRASIKFCSRFLAVSRKLRILQ